LILLNIQNIFNYLIIILIFQLLDYQVKPDSKIRLA